MTSRGQIDIQFSITSYIFRYRLYGRSWVSSNKGPLPFPRGDNNEIAKETLMKLTNLLL